MNEDHRYSPRLSIGYSRSWSYFCFSPREAATEAGAEARRHTLEIRRHGGNPACGAGGEGGGTEALSGCETYERARGVAQPRGQQVKGTPKNAT